MLPEHFSHAPIIGLIGRKRSGKDTFAAPLVEHYGYAKVAFADPLKAAALAADPILSAETFQDEHWDHHTEVYRLSAAVELYGWEYTKDHFPEARRFLQALGTDAIRALDDDFWLRQGQAAIAANVRAQTPTVVTDCRFPNEADAIRQRGGVIVRIIRPGQDTTDLHPSETALDDYRADYTIHNSTTAETLQACARVLAEALAHLAA